MDRTQMLHTPRTCINLSACTHTQPPPSTERRSDMLQRRVRIDFRASKNKIKIKYKKNEECLCLFDPNKLTVPWLCHFCTKMRRRPKKARTSLLSFMWKIDPSKAAAASSRFIYNTQTQNKQWLVIKVLVKSKSKLKKGRKRYLQIKQQYLLIFKGHSVITLIRRTNCTENWI